MASTVYNITTIGISGADYTTMEDINNSGVMIGDYAVSGSTTGFTDIGGQITPLSVPGAADDILTGINNRGEIVGIYGSIGLVMNPHGIDQQSTPASGFVDNHGKFTTIAPANAVRTTLVAINNSGAIVGNYLDTDGARHAFLATDQGQITNLNAPGATNTTVSDINNAGVIIGHIIQPGSIGTQGFIYQNGKYASFNEPDGANGTLPLAINNKGDIAGEYFSSDGNEHGFVFAGGKFTTLDPMTQVRDISIRDIVVGSNLFSTLPLVSSGGTTSLILNPASTGGGPFFTGGVSINNSGVIVGDVNQLGFIATPA